MQSNCVVRNSPNQEKRSGKVYVATLKQMKTPTINNRASLKEPLDK
jgi:hypothetical protein